MVVTLSPPLSIIIKSKSSYFVSISSITARLIDHIQSQKILHKLKPKIQQILDEFKDTRIDECWQFSPGYDLIQMTHEKKFSKMFIT